MWGANKDDIHGWEDACRRARTEGASLFQNRMEDLKLLLPLVRFPLIPLPVLQMVSQRSLTLPQSDICGSVQDLPGTLSGMFSPQGNA